MNRAFTHIHIAKESNKLDEVKTARDGFQFDSTSKDVAAGGNEWKSAPVRHLDKQYRLRRRGLRSRSEIGDGAYNLPAHTKKMESRTMNPHPGGVVGAQRMTCKLAYI